MINSVVQDEREESEALSGTLNASLREKHAVNNERQREVRGVAARRAQ